MIEVEGLTCYYGRFPAIRDLRFTIDAREIVGLLGLNGAGKSTTLRVLAGLLMPSAGTVRIGGQDTGSAPASLRRKIGFLPEDPPLYLDMQVSEFLRWCGQIKGMTRAEADARLPAVLEACRLTDVPNRVIGDLSHGYCKRVGIAQAIIHQPDLVILDEPIAGLDPRQIVGMREVVKSLGRESTVLISSHILSEIAQTCDRILVIDNGALVAEGTEQELAGRFETGARLELTVRGERSAFEAVVARLAWVSSHDVTPSDDGLEVVLELAEDRREELVAALVGAGFGVRRVSDVAGELEGIFLRLTHGEAPTQEARA